MNLEEARNNIGKEVELDESTKPYTFIDDGEVLKGECSIIKGSMKIFSCMNDGNVVVVSDDGIVKEWYLPKHLKLKPQNYKIHVPTEAESREAQGLFFELGFTWNDGDIKVRFTNFRYLYLYENKITFGDVIDNFESHQNKQITLQELRDMVAKKKLESKCFDEAVGSNPLLKVKVECKEMTWQDAFQALIDGKEVEMLDIYNDWENINDYSVDTIKNGEAFRLAPQRITLNGEYTKEELMQKIGEME